MIKHILLDIDGCITDGKNRAMDIALISQLQHRIHTSQAKTLLCTGRSAPYVEAVAQMLGIEGWCICENGAYLYNTREDRLTLNPYIDEETIRYLHSLKQDIIADPDFSKTMKLEFGKEICISLNPKGKMPIQELYEHIRNKIQNKNIYITHSTTAVDITPAGVNKGQLFDYWLEVVENTANQILGVGDSLGDVNFLEKCGVVACPQNATDSVKALSLFIAKGDTTQGLVEIYEWLTEQSGL